MRFKIEGNIVDVESKKINFGEVIIEGDKIN